MGIASCIGLRWRCGRMLAVMLACAVSALVGCRESGSAAPAAAAPTVPVDPGSMATIPMRDDYSEPFRPQYHFSPLSGWIGDPDGLVRYQGRYHLYWWGHAYSDDLVYWHDQIPSVMRDDDGGFTYFSGSVAIDERNHSGFGDGSRVPLLAFYTMHFGDDKPEWQGVSVGYDFSNYFYYRGNPVLRAPQRRFRDPQVFYDAPRRRWLMILSLPDRQTLSLYSSRNLLEWSYLSSFGGYGARGAWWETPDMIEMPVVGGEEGQRKWVVLCSHSPNSVQYFIGDFDGDRFVLDPAANAYLLTGAGLPGRVLADFEDGLPAGWTVSGAETVVERRNPSRRADGLGDGWLLVRGADDGEAVEVESSEFVIDERYINFLWAGKGAASVSLWVDGVEALGSRNPDSAHMQWQSWDVSAWDGKAARLRVVAAGGADGYVAVDHIMLSATPMKAGREHANWLDHGFDYYAVRSFRNYDDDDIGVRTMAWMGNWRYANDVPTSWGRGALALARRLELRRYANGMRLHQQPVEAYAKLRGDALDYTSSALPARGLLSALMGFAPGANVYELDVRFEPDGDDAYLGLELGRRADGGYAMLLGYERAGSRVVLKRVQPETGAFSDHFPEENWAVVEPQDGVLRLRLFVDQSSVEIFANDGEASMTAAMFPAGDSVDVGVVTDNIGASRLTIRAWPLRSIWQDTPGIIQQPR